MTPAVRQSPGDAGQAPASPCIQVCTMADDGYCEGCCRTLAEIAAWSGMSAGEQYAVIARLEVRRERRQPGAMPGEP